MLRSPAALPNWWTSMAMVWVPTVSPAVGRVRVTAFFSAAPVISVEAWVAKATVPAGMLVRATSVPSM